MKKNSIFILALILVVVNIFLIKINQPLNLANDDDDIIEIHFVEERSLKINENYFV